MHPLLNRLALREAIKKLTVRDVTKGWKGWLHCPGNWHLQPVICSYCLLADMWKVQQSINSSETQCFFFWHNVGAKLVAFWNPKSGILTRRWSNPSCVIIFLSRSATFHPSHLTLRGWLALLQDSGTFKKIKYEDTYWLRCHNVQFIRVTNMDRLRFTSLVRLAPRILVFNNAITGRLMSMIYGTALPRVRCTDECVWMCKPGVTYSHRPSAPSALLWAVQVQCGGHL